MWKTLAVHILRHRRLLVSVLLVLTGFLGWHAKDAEITYDLDNVVSPQDPDLRYFQQFRHTFGEDGNVLVIGLDDSRAYRLAGFTDLRNFSQALARVPGVLGVISLPTLTGLHKDPHGEKLTVSPLFAPFPSTQHQLDSLLRVIRQQPQYEGQLLNPRTGATLLALNLDPAYVNSARMQDVLQHITDQADRFEQFEKLVLHHRSAVYACTGVLLLTAAVGLSRVRAVAYMVDDIPQNSSVRADLQFFQQQFSGVMPLEIVVNTGKKGGVMSRQNLARIDQFEQYLATLPGLTPSVSVVTGLKAATQAFYNNAPGTYRLPDATEQGFVLSSLAGAKATGSSPSALLRTLVDSTGQQARLSLRMADVGSNKLDTLMNQQIAPEARRLFAGSRLQAHLTGTTLLFTKGTAYLIRTLKDSLLLAFGLVGLVVLLLFRSRQAVGFALLPNLVTLVLTGGLMGYLGIPLKPSTALIFSIALGIDGDNSIHLLAKFRQELASNGGWARRAIATTLREAGTSLLYTSVVLLLGFGIFSFSDFGGTQALGILMGASLLITNFSNLVLLPCLLVTITPAPTPEQAPARVRTPGATALRRLVPARSRQ
jgi:predicted RND superfamily exporter protein